MKRLCLIACLAACPAAAQTTDLPRSCTGQSPDWSLTLEGDQATFSFIFESDLNLMLETIAERSDWPRALTYIGRGDSAIVLLEAGNACRYDTASDSTMSANILTQRGETPVLLTGCCRP